MLGDPAVGVERHYLSLVISKLQQGFNIKSGNIFGVFAINAVPQCESIIILRTFIPLPVSALFFSCLDVTNITLLFEGEKTHLLPATSEAVLEVDLFIVAGRMIGHSFLHGGPLLSGLSEAVIHMITNGDIDTATITIQDVADYDIRETIQMVCKRPKIFSISHFPRFPPATLTTNTSHLD